MAFNRRNHRAAANDFRLHNLLKHEAEALFRSWYPFPPDMRVGKKFASVPVPDAPRPRETDWTAAVLHHYGHELTAEQR